MIPLFKVNMTKDPTLIQSLNKILQSGYIGEGEEVVKFEKDLRYVLECEPTPIAVNSCTSAIFLALLSLGVGPGDEVITTPLTCTATNVSIILLGARPVWADVEPDTGNIEAMSLGSRITPRTKAIIAVDWTGRPCNYDLLRAYGLPVIQDAAHGPRYDKWNCGDVTCLSFGPIKHLTSGDGGAIIVNRIKHFWPDTLRRLRWYGLDRTSSKNFRCEQNISQVGGKFHMNNINASIGRSNLPELKETIIAHQMNAFELHEGIQNPLVEVCSFSFVSNFWVFPIRLPSEGERDYFQKYMSDHGIEASRVHARNDKHTGMNYPGRPTPGLDEFDKRQINLPCGPWVTKNDLQHIISTVNSYKGIVND